jgi:hypothetical protein
MGLPSVLLRREWVAREKHRALEPLDAEIGDVAQPWSSESLFSVSEAILQKYTSEGYLPYS